MKKTIPNPAYEEAPYELGWMQKGEVLYGFDPHPRRFNNPPPSEVWLNQDTLWEWVKSNSVPKFILIDEEDHTES